MQIHSWGCGGKKREGGERGGGRKKSEVVAAYKSNTEVDDSSLNIFFM